MKRMKWISCFLTLLFLCTILFTGMPQNASAATEELQKIREVTELRTEYAKAFELSNGQYVYEVHASPIHYTDSLENFQDINNAITLTDRSGYQFTNTANAWHVYFSDYITDDNAIYLQYGESSISLSLKDASLSKTVQKTSVLKGDASEYDEALSEDNRSVVYQNVSQNVDIVYTAMVEGLKEDIVLRDPSAQASFTFLLKTKGLKMVEEEGITYFLNQEGNAVFELGSLFMEDAKGKRSEDIACSIKEVEDGYEVTITAAKVFLEAADTAFPVVVDPSIIVRGSSTTYDTYVACQCSQNPCTCTNGTTNYNRGSTLSYLRMGKDSPYGVRRAYIRFVRPSLPATSVLHGAYIELYRHSSAGSINVTAYRVSGNSWDSNTITWRNKPAYTTTNNSGVAKNAGNGWWYMDVTYWIGAFYNGTPDYGFCIKDSTENNINVWSTWRSSDYSGTTYDPVLRIFYSIYNEVTVRVTAEEKFRAQHPSDYVSLMNNYVEAADNAFYNTFGVDLNVTLSTDISGMPGTACTLPINDGCNTNCGAITSCNTLHHRNMSRNSNAINSSITEDIRVCFLGYTMCYYDSTKAKHSIIMGCAASNKDQALVRTTDDYNTIVRTVQHEVSHLFGCDDATTGDGCNGPCIMSGGFDGQNYVENGNIWCYNCMQDFNSNLQ